MQLTLAKSESLLSFKPSQCAVEVKTRQKVSGGFLTPQDFE